MKKDTLSILIPVYNGCPSAMAAELLRQAGQIDSLQFELLLIDDGSPQRHLVEQCRAMEQWPHTRFIALEENIGRSRIRNRLAREARHEWLLFIDCDMTIISPTFVSDYLHTEGDVVYGGYRVGEGDAHCLRYVYEQANAHEHTAEQRRTRPYQHFHTSNFMVRRDVLLQHPFDESFTRYGYEDVLLGKQFKQAGIVIQHIDNPVGFCSFEDNAHFVAKTEEGLRTLHDKRDLLRGYSRMITVAEGIHLPPVRWLISLWHRLFGPLERRALCGNSPSLRIFKLYKLGYYLSL